MDLTAESVHSKLERAEFHAQTLYDEIRPWLRSNPFELRQVVNADSTRYSVVAHLVGDEPPVSRWTLHGWRSVHNLRCALDHLIYAIAVHESGIDPPPDERNLMFPIADVPQSFLDSAYRIKSLSSPVRAAIESVQPYNRSHATLPPLLGVLRDLENTDKHRLSNRNASFALRFSGAYLLSPNSWIAA